MGFRNSATERLLFSYMQWEDTSRLHSDRNLSSYFEVEVCPIMVDNLEILRRSCDGFQLLSEHVIWPQFSVKNDSAQCSDGKGKGKAIPLQARTGP
jgi:hypothetical protein